MNLLTKSAVGALGLSGASVVGCYAGGLLKFGGSGGEGNVVQPVTWEPLNKDSNFAETYTGENMIGKMYGQYFVSATEASNEEWWNKSYASYLKDKEVANALSTEFGTDRITLPYSTSDGKALNKVCGEMYSKNAINDLSFDTESSDETKKKLGSNILKYCSPLTQKPAILNANDSNYGETTIGYTKGVAKKLVGLNENDGFWEAQQKWLTKPESRNLGSYFSQFFDGNDGSKKLKEGEDIKTICKNAYEKIPPASGPSTKSEPTADDVAKYCSFAKLSSASVG